MRDSWYLAPASDPSDEWAAGYDGNDFATREEAEAVIPQLVDHLGGDWVAVSREEWRRRNIRRAGR